MRPTILGLLLSACTAPDPGMLLCGWDQCPMVEQAITHEPGPSEPCWRITAPPGALLSSGAQDQICEVERIGRACVVLGRTDEQSLSRQTRYSSVPTRVAAEPVPCDAVCR